MNLTAGQRITTRGEDFLITDVITNNDGSFILSAEGISELVKDKSISSFTAKSEKSKWTETKITERHKRVTYFANKYFDTSKL